MCFLCEHGVQIFEMTPNLHIENDGNREELPNQRVSNLTYTLDSFCPLSSISQKDWLNISVILSTHSLWGCWPSFRANSFRSCFHFLRSFLTLYVCVAWQSSCAFGSDSRAVSRLVYARSLTAANMWKSGQSSKWSTSWGCLVVNWTLELWLGEAWWD